MKNLKVLLGALSMLTLGSANASTLVLDSFNYNPALSLTVNPVTTLATGSAISVETGATADYTLTHLGGAGSDTAIVNEFASGQLKYSEASGIDGKLDIKYSIDAPVGFNTLDFTGYTAFYFDVTDIDGSGGFDILLTLTDVDGTQISATYNIANSGIFYAQLSAMMAGPDFDFSQVLSAEAHISSQGTGDDFALDEVGLVPEPSALALLGLGLIGLGLRRRKLV